MWQKQKDRETKRRQRDGRLKKTEGHKNRQNAIRQAVR